MYTVIFRDLILRRSRDFATTQHNAIATMNLRNYESRATHQAWGTGSGSPAFMVLACLVVNFIALIVTIVVNTTVVRDGSNDYGEG